ncbi:MAG: hypothetical protein AAF587_44705 [Bacteroidota bacterium]
MAEELKDNEWIISLQGDDRNTEAIRKLQRKVLALDIMMNGIIDKKIAAKPVAAAKQASKEEDEKQDRYYYVFRGKYNEQTKDFFKGFVTREEYIQMNQGGISKFAGKSMSDPARLIKYIMEMTPRYEEESKTFFNEEMVYSPNWYVVLDLEAYEWWIVPDYKEADDLFKGHSGMDRKQFNNFPEALAFKNEQVKYW